MAAISISSDKDSILLPFPGPTPGTRTSGMAEEGISNTV